MHNHFFSIIVRFIVVIAFFFSCIFNATGQVKLKLVDPDGFEIPYANTQLLNSDGTNEYLGAASDTNGVVIYTNLQPATYDMVIRYLGFKTDTIYNIVVMQLNEFIDLGKVGLIPLDHLLNEINIVAKGPKIIYESNGDFTFNPGSTSLGSNQDADKLLETIPGVSYNSRNGYTINGNSNIVVLVDGRTLSGDRATMESYLESIASENIESVKIVKSATAKYSASASGGVIDIITKKSSYAGINGFIYNRFRQGQYASNRARFSLNWKYRKLSGNIFYENNYYQGFHEVEVSRTIENGANDIANYEETIYETWKFKLHIGRMFFNYHINENNRLGLLLEFRNGNIYHPIMNNAFPSRNGMQPDSIITNDILKKDVDLWPALSFNYATNIKGKGNKLDFAYDFFYKDINNVLDFKNQIYDANQTIVIGSSQFQRNNSFKQPVHTASIGFSRSFNRDISIDLGAKLTMVNKESESDYDILINGDFVKDPSLSRSFEYKERTYAGYVNWNKEFDGWNLTLGFRTEYTTVDQFYKSDDSLVMSSYFDYFPSISFSKTLGKEVDFRIGYTRGLTRPSFRELDPIRIELGPFLVSSGNPILKPQLDNLLSMEFTFKKKYSLFANYNATNYSINSIFQKEGDEVFNITYANFERCHLFNAGGNVGTEINEWWTLNADVNVYFDKYKTTIDSQKIVTKGAATSFSVNSQFSLPKDFLFDLDANYESPRYYAIERYKSTGYINMALTKNLFDDKFTIKIKVYDVLKTRKIETEQNNFVLNSTYFEVGDSRKFELLLNYRFRKGENFRANRNKRSNDDERIRSF